MGADHNPGSLQLYPGRTVERRYNRRKRIRSASYKDSSITQFWYFDDQYVQKYNIDLESIKTMKDLDAPFRAMKEGEGKSFYPLQMAQGSRSTDFSMNMTDLPQAFSLSA